MSEYPSEYPFGLRKGKEIESNKALQERIKERPGVKLTKEQEKLLEAFQKAAEESTEYILKKFQNKPSF